MAKKTKVTQLGIMLAQLRDEFKRSNDLDLIVKKQDDDSAVFELWEGDNQFESPVGDGSFKIKMLGEFDILGAKVPLVLVNGFVMTADDCLIVGFANGYSP